MKGTYADPGNFRNRELSWLEFDARVLAEAKDTSIPLFERLKFLSITSSNLDEFFMVRVASLGDMDNSGYTGKDIAGMTPAAQLEAIADRTHELVKEQYQSYRRSFKPSLAQNHLHIIDDHHTLTQAQGDFVDTYFQKEVYPILTPMAVDSSRPFPLIRNKSLNIGMLIRGKGKKKGHDFATVQVPSVLDRYMQIPSEEPGDVTIILLEQVIERNLGKLFSGYEVICCSPYRIMRNADLPIDEDDAEDLLSEVEKVLRRRQWGEVIRLEVEEGADKRLLKILKKEFAVRERAIYHIGGPLDLTFLMKVSGMPQFSRLRYAPYVPQPVPGILPGDDLFEKIRERDILLSHPYQTFDPVVDFIRQGASDPLVLAIKMTLYRVSADSPIIASLARAAEAGKQVTVLVELKARFDEENNIIWARKLEQAGCHVIYGLRGLKTHSKIALIIRRGDEGIRRYVHLGTGNYNDATARLYTDMGLLTCSEQIGEDATAVFNMISGYAEPPRWHKLVLAPIWLRERFLTLIRRETEHAREGREGRIIAKMNSLCDAQIIEALYEASCAGVQIDLIVRGICCLKAGIPGLSEHIRVRSIVGNFLEHSRIFYWYNDGYEEIYMGSADWMPRNLDKRVEILFPVEAKDCRDAVRHLLDVQLEDNVKASVLQPDGSYARIDKRGRIPVNSQRQLCEEAMAGTGKRKKTGDEMSRRFEPVYREEEED